MKSILAFILALAAVSAQAQSKAVSYQLATNPENIPQDDHSSKLYNLKLGMVMRFPSTIRTVYDAARYCLEPIHYRLINLPNNPQESQQILARPVLSSYQVGSYTTIESALLQLAGNDTILIVDDEHKLVTFALSRAARRTY